MLASKKAYQRGVSLPSSNPFQRLAELLSGEMPGLDPIEGSPEFRAAIASWLDRRYNLGGLIDADHGVLPLNGSREGLSFGAIAARDQLNKGLDHPVVILPNPFYQTYAAAAHVADAEAVLLDAVAGNNFLPDLDTLDADLLEKTVAFYVASPTNPEGFVADTAYWQRLIGLARKHRFYIFADECYSEIYRETPPVGILEAARDLNEEQGGGFANIIVLNSRLCGRRSRVPEKMGEVPRACRSASAAAGTGGCRKGLSGRVPRR